MGLPIQRTAVPEEVAALVSYVASDGAGYVTGKVDFFLERHVYSHPALLFVLAEGQCVCILSSASCRGLSDILTDFH